MTMTDRLAQLSDAGVSIWLDDLSRQRLTSGQLAGLIRDHSVVGVTTNPTIFANAVASGDNYQAQLRELSARGVEVHDAVREITTTDVRDACDVFRSVYDATGRVDGRVSLEVDPELARDTERTVTEALELAKAVDRPNLFVKIPATEQGLPAITRTLGEGVSVNVTLIFSVERYREVIDAYMSGLQQARANGHQLSGIHSVASFFVSRVDAEMDKRLEAIGTDEALSLRGQAAIANARVAHAVYRELFGTDRWQALRVDGAHVQRPLWASTGVKNPEYSDTRYVDRLVTAGVVNTMPEPTLHAVADHAEIDGDTVVDGADAARKTFEKLATAGVDLDDAFRTLENEGVDKFVTSWHELLETVSGQLG
ncbi:MAG: transaldolase [Actinophytocola sp.]|nr:transaldolase [Actinophytocola sp.]